MSTNKIPRKYNFTKNRWPSENYENLEDQVLKKRIEEIEKDSNRLNLIPENYKTFINELKKIGEEHSKCYNEEFVQSYDNKFERKTISKIEKEFIFFENKYEEYDIYFKKKEYEEKFFAISRKLCDIFQKAINLYNRFHVLNDMKHFRYFYQKESLSKNALSTISYPLWEGPFSEDIIQFTELKRQKWMSHHSFDPKPCTLRTAQLMADIHNIIKEKKLWDKNEKREYHLPNFPTISYAEWYFKKIVEENNKIRRQIELILRSRKRSVELANNPNYIYVMSNEGYPKDTYKIGWTSRLPEERAEDLSTTGVIYDFKVEYETKFKDAEKIEKEIHKHFDEFRFRKNKEVFTVKLKKIIEYIESLKK